VIRTFITIEETETIRVCCTFDCKDLTEIEKETHDELMAVVQKFFDKKIKKSKRASKIDSQAPSVVQKMRNYQEGL
jgi:hypothetical protein